MPRFVISGTHRGMQRKREIEATNLKEAQEVATALYYEANDINVSEVRPVAEQTPFRRESEEREL